MLLGCVCDSSWPVGLNAGQTQEPEWFEADCSKSKLMPLPSFMMKLKVCLLHRIGHCPSGDDPMTTKNETNCFGRGILPFKYKGKRGNLCHVDCSNRGVCNYETGICKCFDNFYGPNCGIYAP